MSRVELVQGRVRLPRLATVTAPAWPPTSRPAGCLPLPAVLRSKHHVAERRSLLLLLLVLAGTILVLAGVGVRGVRGVRVGVQMAGRLRADGALQRAALEQSEFHAEQGRFALWWELEATGLGLPPRMRVDASNATASHWYLRLHDSASGQLCDRVGTLVDELTEHVPPSCRSASR
jgi:hypothetical protein